MISVLLSLALTADPTWKQVDATDGITVEAREVEGSPYAELKATATVKLPVEALCAGAFGTPLRDPKEPSLKSRKLISETENERVTYDQISTPVVSDRDLAVRTKRERSPDGSCRVRVEVANDQAPPETSDYVRLEKLHCSWEFIPQPGGDTLIRYISWTDPKTSMPAAFFVEPSRRKVVITWTKLVIERAALAQAKQK